MRSCIIEPQIIDSIIYDRTDTTDISNVTSDWEEVLTECVLKSENAVELS